MPPITGHSPVNARSNTQSGAIFLKDKYLHVCNREPRLKVALVAVWNDAAQFWSCVGRPHLDRWRYDISQCQCLSRCLGSRGL